MKSMYDFKLNDLVIGYTHTYNTNTEDYTDCNNFVGVVTHDFEDGSYTVYDKEQGKEFLVELYNEWDKMELHTKLGKVLV